MGITMGLLITNFLVVIKRVCFACIHHILVYSYQQNRLKTIPQLLRQNLTESEFELGWLLLLRATSCLTLPSWEAEYVVIQANIIHLSYGDLSGITKDISEHNGFASKLSQTVF